MKKSQSVIAAQPFVSIAAACEILACLALLFLLVLFEKGAEVIKQCANWLYEKIAVAFILAVFTPFVVLFFGPFAILLISAEEALCGGKRRKNNKKNPSDFSAPLCGEKHSAC